jgi:hypothetical protein
VSIKTKVAYKPKSTRKPKDETQQAADRLGRTVNERMDRYPEVPLYKMRSYYWKAVDRLRDKGYDKDFYEMAAEYGWHNEHKTSSRIDERLA